MNQKLTTLLETSSQPDMAIIKSILIDADIPFHIQGETFSTMYGGNLPCKVLIPEDCLEEAQELLKDFLSF